MIFISIGYAIKNRSDRIAHEKVSVRGIDANPKMPEKSIGKM